MVGASPQRPGQDHKPAPSPPSEGVGVALPPSSDADLALEPGSSSVPSQPPPEPPHTHGPPEPQSWLNTLVSDLASVFLFSGIGTALAVLTPLAGPRDVLGPLVAALGLWGVGVERGKIRPPSMAVCVLLSTWAAAIHFGGEVWFFGPAGIGLPLIARTALIAVIGAFLPIVATRFDRGETAWRISARCGPPTGFAPMCYPRATWWRTPPSRSEFALRPPWNCAWNGGLRFHLPGRWNLYWTAPPST
ncbi:MAG: hypothetical protein JKY65_34150, partial [Planctomycetes bacterium]|nr:hypothetical protein [Planctomycetota bacterium]